MGMAATANPLTLHAPAAPAAIPPAARTARPRPFATWTAATRARVQASVRKGSTTKKWACWTPLTQAA